MFKCSNCDFKTSVIKKYNRHLYEHRGKKNMQYICLEPHCEKKFHSYKNFQVHCFRSHSSQKILNTVVNISPYKCSINNCDFKSKYLKKITSHLTKHINLNSEISCPVGSCSRIFSNGSSFRSHVSRKHYGNLGNLSDQKETLKVLETQSLENEPIDLIQSTTSFVSTKRENPFETLFTKLKFSFRVSDAALQFLYNELYEIINTASSNQNYFLKDIGMLTKYKNDISFNCLLDEIKKFGSKFKRESNIRNKMPFVKPKKVPLGFDNYHNECFFHYTPILETIKMLMSDSQFLKLIREGKNEKQNIFFDYNDGSVYKKNIFFSSSPKKLEIILFQDAFETCNPLGSSKKKHKLVGVYMLIGNLNIKYRTQIQNIQLVLLCKEKFVKLFGIDKIFQPLIEDLIILEKEGVDYFDCFDQTIKNIQGSLFAMTGDNLGSHQIGGFVENFSSTEFFCRWCYFTRTSLKNYDLQPGENRTIENYSTDVLDTNHGIKSDSVLNRLLNFHVCNPGLPPCLAHDLFEGIIPYDLMYILKYFSNSGFISLDKINITLSNLRKKFKLSLSFPKIEGNKPKVPGKAYEIWHILVMMPLILMNHIENLDDIVWKFLTTMVEMCRLICASEISNCQIELLSHYIYLYYEYRKDCFPSYKLRPKHHFIYHYPELIRKFGPLKILWTMEFEQKNKYFKTTARMARNYQNITSTLSENHQLMQVGLFEDRFQLFISSDNVLDLTDSMFNITLPNGFCFVSKKIVYFNTIYKENDFVLVNCNELGNIEILQINAIFLDKSYQNAVFYGKTIKMFYNENLCLYENFSEKCGPYSICHLEKLLVKKPLHLLKKTNIIFLLHVHS